MDGTKTNIMSAQELASQHAPVRARQVERTLSDTKGDVRTVIIVLALMFVALLGFIRYMNSVNKPTQGVAASTEAGGLYCGLRIYDRSSKMPIELQMSMYNVSGHPITVKFSKEPALDFIVQRQVNLFFTKIPMEIWRFSDVNNRFYFGPDASMEIMPGEEKVFHGEWNRIDRNGKKVAGTRFVITGNMNIEGDVRSLLVE